MADKLRLVKKNVSGKAALLKDEEMLWGHAYTCTQHFSNGRKNSRGFNSSQQCFHRGSNKRRHLVCVSTQIKQTASHTTSNKVISCDAACLALESGRGLSEAMD